MTWIEVRATSGSRVALVRCAIELLGERGVEIVRVGPPEGADARRIEVRGGDVARAMADVRAALEDRVAFAEADAPRDAWEPKEFLAGFPIEAIDHTADEAFAVTAPDRADLLAAAAEALGGLIVLPERVRAACARPVEVRAPEEAWADDDRLFAWLAEVLYTLDAGRFALRRAVVFEDSAAAVRGAIFGEPIDEARHEVRGGIKAVTYHGLAIEPVPGGLRATVVVDV